MLSEREYTGTTLALALLSCAACGSTSATESHSSSASEGDASSALDAGRSGHVGPGDGGDMRPPSGPDASHSDSSSDRDAGVRVALDAASGHAPDAGSSQPSVTLSAALCGADKPWFPTGTAVWVGAGGTSGHVLGSKDGVTWTEQTTVTHGETMPGHSRNLIRNIGYGDGVWVAVGGYDNAYITLTCDGHSYRHDVLGTNIDGTIPTQYASWLGDVAYSNGVFVAGGGNGIILVSRDHGSTWNPVGNGAAGHFRGAAAGAGTFVLAGHTWDGVGMIYVSDDAATFSPATLPSGGELAHDVNRGVAYGNGTFVTVGLTRCLVSSTGHDWQDCGAPATSFAGVEFDGGLFKLRLADGKEASSTDGKTWSAVTASPVRGVYFQADGRWVTSGGQQRGYSTDGKSWTLENVSSDENVDGLAVGRVLFK